MTSIHIDVITTPYDQKNSEKITAEKIVVVIDILRATSTIVTAFEAGVHGIYPTLTVQEAFDKRSESCSDNMLLCGEREGRKVAGFDLGNSPLEYTPDVVSDKTMVMSSTNGTKAIRRSLDGNCIIMGSFLNGEAVAQFIINRKKDVVFYLSGKLGTFSYEDAAGAGFIIHELLRLTSSSSVTLTDAASMCLDLYQLHKDNPVKLLQTVSHGKYLESEGFGADLVYCAERNISNIVPVVCDSGLIKPVPVTK
jgi:2-phosphosulfolactate phosphatase